MTTRKPGSIVRDLERTVEQIRVLDTRRDNLIREALAADVPVKDLAATVGVSVQRIYQIRNNRASSGHRDRGSHPQTKRTVRDSIGRCNH